MQQFAYNEQAQDLALDVVFDHDMIEQILRDTGQAIWAGSRVQTLVLFTYPEQGTYALLSSDDDASTLLTRAAQKRGIEVVLPIIDLTSQAVIDIPEDSEEMQSFIHNMAAHYHVDQVLFGRESASGGEVHWRLFTEETHYNWSDSFADYAQMMHNAVDHVVDDMVSRDAVFQGAAMEGAVRVSFSHIDSLSRYAALLKLCNNSPIIKQFDVRAVQSDQVVLDIVSKGGSVSLAEDLQQYSRKLKPLIDPMAYNNVDMAYTWVGE